MAPSLQIHCPCGVTVWLNRTSKRGTVSRFRALCPTCGKTLELVVREPQRRAVP